MAPRWHNLPEHEREYWHRKGVSRLEFDSRAALRDRLDRITYVPLNNKRPLSPSNSKGLCNCDGVPE